MIKENEREKLVYGETDVEREDPLGLHPSIHLKYIKIKNNLQDWRGGWEAKVIVHADAPGSVLVPTK